MSLGIPELFASFLLIRDNNTLIISEAKKKGRKVVGLYCTYGPRELVLAANAIGVGLCGTREEPIPAAEKDLPRSLCPLIKSSYGFGVTGECPYFHFSDLIIGETTCDGKKKMFELMQEFKPVHVMNLPQNPNLPASLELMYQEMLRLKDTLEEHLETKITEAALREAISIVNRGNRALKALYDLNKTKPAILTGIELLTISWQVGFHSDRWERIRLIENVVEEIKTSPARELPVLSGARILLTGVPVGMGSEKVISLVEEEGGCVVTMENCGGYKTLDLDINEDDDRDPLLLLAEKYLKITCSIMSPNSGRLDLLKQMIPEFQIDGVIDLTWQGCHTYNVESTKVKKLVKEEMGLPFLHLETDYSQNDLEGLRVRISAFLEMI